MIFVKNSRGGMEVNIIMTVSKIGWEGGGSTSIWIMSLNIQGGFWTLFLSEELFNMVSYSEHKNVSNQLVS